MKTRIATLTVLLGLFITSTAFASAPVPASKAVSNSVALMISNELEYPEFAISDKYEGVVAVSFTIQNDGTFSVDASNALNDEMRKHVIKTIHNMQSDRLAKYAGQQVFLKITFDLKMV
ncbi:energy transducer TonB [bacterium]|nr:energy transducer TonB [bacterium]